jgi:uncharacterized membrane protein YfcA
MTDALLAALLGLGAGAVSGLFGVGGGVLFVPALTLVLGLSQLHAEATSLAAIIPVALAGVWRQHGYGNMRWRPAITIGIASVAGVGVGVVAARALPERDLQRLFGVLLLLVAAQLLWSLRSRAARRETGG